MTRTPLDAVRAALRAYVDKDRAAIEAVIAEDYHFTSPYDNRIDRKTYFERCWPNAQHTDRFDEVHATERGDVAYIVYLGRTGDHRFRNCEVHTVRDGKIVETEVYFGWDVPHKAKAGGFIDSDKSGGGNGDPFRERIEGIPRRARQIA